MHDCAESLFPLEKHLTAVYVRVLRLACQQAGAEMLMWSQALHRQHLRSYDQQQHEDQPTMRRR